MPHGHSKLKKTPPALGAKAGGVCLYSLPDQAGAVRLGGDLPGVHEIAEIRPHRAAHEGILGQGHGEAVGGKYRGQQLVKGHVGTQGGDAFRCLVGAVDVVLRQRRDVLRGRRMGGDEQTWP